LSLSAPHRLKTWDKESKAWAVGQSWDAGLIIMGKKSFEVMAPYWPTSTDASAAPMNETPKAVFTKKGFKGVDPGHEPSPAAASRASRFTSKLADVKVFPGGTVVHIYQP
jgi:dihydrofolate reductase